MKTAQRTLPQQREGLNTVVFSTSSATLFLMCIHVVSSLLVHAERNCPEAAILNILEAQWNIAKQKDQTAKHIPNPQAQTPKMFFLFFVQWCLGWPPVVATGARQSQALKMTYARCWRNRWKRPHGPACPVEPPLVFRTGEGVDGVELRQLHNEIIWQSDIHTSICIYIYIYILYTHVMFIPWPLTTSNVKTPRLNNYSTWTCCVLICSDQVHAWLQWRFKTLQISTPW